MGVTTRDLLYHLMDRYGNMTAANIKANEARINEAFIHSQPIDVFFQHINDAVQYADEIKTVYSKNNLANDISLRQRNHHIPRGMQGMATKRRR